MTATILCPNTVKRDQKPSRLSASLLPCGAGGHWEGLIKVWGRGRGTAKRGKKMREMVQFSKYGSWWYCILSSTSSQSEANSIPSMDPGELDIFLNIRNKMLVG